MSSEKGRKRYSLRVQPDCDVGIGEKSGESDVMITKSVNMKPSQRLIAKKTKKARYSFRAQAVCEVGIGEESDQSVQVVCEVGIGEKSDESDVITTQSVNMKLSQRLIAKSTLIQNSTPPTYKVDATDIWKHSTFKIRKCEIGETMGPLQVKADKVIMIVGATGAGKSTLVNGMINYLFGVEWKDPFRFKLIDEKAECASQGKTQAMSQTEYITAYTVHQQADSPVPFTLTIIDTPGFGDTKGIKRDRVIIDQVKNFFSSAGVRGIDHLNAVGFVTQSPLARLTPAQMYVFDSILAIFGNDIGENIFAMITFADGKKPPVLAALKAANIPFKKSFKFNNSALYTRAMNNSASDPEDSNSEDEDTNFDEMFWKMGMVSFKKFFYELNSVTPKSLALTNEVLSERDNLETCVQGLQYHIRLGLARLNELEQEQQILERFKAEIETTKNFEYVINVPKINKIDLDPGTYVTNCSKCNITCHYPCSRFNDADKVKCAAMENGKCTVCVGSCVWNVHFNMRYRFKCSSVPETRTFSNLKKRYTDASEKKSLKETVMKRMLCEVNNLRDTILHMINDVRRYILRLEEIALKPNPLSTVDYIDLLIQSEEREAQPGFLDRINALKEIRKQAELISDIKGGEYDPFEEYQARRKYASNPAQSRKDGWKEKFRHAFSF